jgi:hypothetical protein
MSRTDPDAVLHRIGERLARRDLVPMRPLDGLVECLHPARWLLASWRFASQSPWLPALPSSFMFFLTALRLNHEAIHRNLGFFHLEHHLFPRCRLSGWGGWRKGACCATICRIIASPD